MHNVTLPSYHNPRIREGNGENAWQGSVRWSFGKSMWITLMSGAGIFGVMFTSNWQNFMVFLVTTAVTLCFGHSLGMHRRFIHQSYQCPKWLEYILVYLGVLVGLAGPLGMMYTHDLRDWAQRQYLCHAYFGHKAHWLKDAFWQMHCDIHLCRLPNFVIETDVADDRFYRYLERTWMWQQIPIAMFMFLLGGFDWVIWGVCLRVSVSVSGHWLIGHIAHNRGHRDWHIEGAAIQGFNVKFCGIISMGECWHNNHHAFPGSALLGIQPGQSDPGWWCLLLMKKIGLVWELKEPAMLAFRPELKRISGEPINEFDSNRIGPKRANRDIRI